LSKKWVIEKIKSYRPLAIPLERVLKFAKSSIYNSVLFINYIFRHREPRKAARLWYSTFAFMPRRGRPRVSGFTRAGHESFGIL